MVDEADVERVMFLDKVALMVTSASGELMLASEDVLEHAPAGNIKASICGVVTSPEIKILSSSI